MGDENSLNGDFAIFDGLFFQSKEHSPKKTLRNFYKIIKKLIENSLQYTLQNIGIQTHLLLSWVTRKPNFRVPAPSLT